MKKEKENGKTNKSAAMHILHIFGLIVCALCIYILVVSFSKKENDSIVRADSNTYSPGRRESDSESRYLMDWKG